MKRPKRKIGGNFPMADIKKVVLAYSGGLDTSIIIPWLKENWRQQAHRGGPGGRDGGRCYHPLPENGRYL